MISAYKEHNQFILILIIMYVIGVWLDPLLYVVFPIMMLLFGMRQRFFELLICAIWMLILSDYIPVDGATYADLQFAKDLKPLVPLMLFGFMIMHRDRFLPAPKFIVYFIPFFVIAIIALNYSIKFNVGVQKTISFILMYVTIPIYVNMLHREQGEFFWRSLFTYLIGMLAIGVVLGFAIPQIGLLPGGGRFKGIFGNPNGLGVFLNLTLILWVIIEEFSLTSFTKKERWFTAFVIIFSVLWCGSRNAIMSMILFYLIYRLVKVNLFVGILMIFTFLSFSEIIFQFLIDSVSFFGLESYFRVDSLEKGSGRQLAWYFAWTQIQDYFFVGGGFGHDENIMRPNYSWLTMQGHDGGVHNSYLSMWFNTGVIGVIFYYGSLVLIYLKTAKSTPIMLAFIVSIFFNSTYESWLVASLNPFTIIFLIVLTIFAETMRGEEKVSENTEVLAVSNDEVLPEPA